MKSTKFLSRFLALMAVQVLVAVALAQGAAGAGIVINGDLEGPDYLQPPQYYRTLEMMLAEAQQGPGVLGPPPVHVTGTREILVILTQLTDATPAPAHNAAYFYDRFFDTNPPSVRDFYMENSYGTFTFVPGAVLGWYASTFSSVDWNNDKNVNPSDPDCRDVVREAITLANADFNFAPYDFNNDGTVTNDELTIFIIVSGTPDGAFHWFAGGIACNGKTVEGEFSATHEERHIGSYCHELGHDLGLPDLYDTDAAGTGPSEGIGNYGVMGGGSWTLAQMDAWCRIQLGWVTPTIVTVSGFYDVHDLETHPEAYILVDPSHSTTEYFIVENRHPSNSRYEMLGPPVAPSGTYPDSGIVIYHIDDAQAQGWITSGNNNVNADETHKCVDVETVPQPTSHVIDADDLDATTNRGDGADLWDSGAYDFRSGSTPCDGVWYGGGANHIMVGQFPAVSPTMRVYLSVSNVPPVAACRPFSAHAGAGCGITVNVADVDNGSSDPDGPGDIASLCITAVDGVPVGCQPGVEVYGEGAHTVTLTITDLSGMSDACDASVEVLNGAPVAVAGSYGADGDQTCCITVATSDIDGGSYDPDGAGDIVSLCITSVDGSPVGCVNQVEVCGEGMHSVALTITDICGDASTATAQVEVINHPPVAVCQAFSANADDNCCIMVHVADIDGGTYDPDGAGDIASFGITGIDGGWFAAEESVGVCGQGSHTVTLTVTDWCGEVSNCDAAVEVIDITPPEITVTLDRDALWPPNHKMADVAAEVVVTDNCDPDPTFVLTAIYSSEPDNGLGDGDTPRDVQGADLGTPDLAFQLRSERSGGGDGRLYTIYYTASDNSGNTAPDTAYVRVPHDRSGSALASAGFSADGTCFDPEFQCFALVVPSRPARFATDPAGSQFLAAGAFDATALDVSRVYVGNLRGALVPAGHLDTDANGDGLVDLAVWYSTAEAERLFGSLTMSAANPWLNVAFDPEIPDALPDPADPFASDGPVGLHYVGADGTDYLVPNVFHLGSPIPLDVELPNSPSGVDGQGGGVTALLPSYPNPFGRSTTIPFNLAAPGYVTLDVYNARGVLVRTLEAGAKPAGLHMATWNGRDATDRPVAAGIYFARLRAGDRQINQKLLLLK